MDEERCHCGQPLHYVDPHNRELVDALIKDLGPLVDVTVRGRTWRVPRHYIALHGLKAAELATLGFEEVPHEQPPSITCPRCGATSFHPKDIDEGYCGHCHDWTRR